MSFTDRVLADMERKNVSMAEVLPSYQSGRPQDKEWDATKAIKEGYRASATVFACVDKRAAAVAQLPWYVEELKSDDEWERPKGGHPLNDLLERPNASMGRNDFFTRIVQQLDIDGNAILTKLMVGGEVRELWPLQTRPVRVIPSRTEFIAGYEYQDGDVNRIIPASGVIHVMRQDPGNPYWGMPPLRAISRVVDTVVQAMLWNRQVFENRAMPEILFTINAALNQEDAELAQDAIQQMYAGAINARKPLVVGNGATGAVINWKPTELDYIASLHYYRQEICKVYGVPLSVLGILEDAPNATLQDSRRIFWEDTVLPFADIIKGALNRGLIRDPTRTRLCYDASQVPALREDMTAKVDQYAKLVQWGTPRNDAVKFLGMDMEDVEGGDVPVLPATSTPMDLLTDLAQEQVRATQASTQTTLNPPKDPNKTPKPRAA